MTLQKDIWPQLVSKTVTIMLLDFHLCPDQLSMMMWLWLWTHDITLDI